MLRMRFRFVLPLTLLVLAPKLLAGPAAAASRGSAAWFCHHFESSSAKKGDGSKASSAVQQCIELINSGVSQKRFRFDSAAAVRCAEHQAGCSDVVAGLVPLLGSCESTLDCTQPLVCISLRAGTTGQCQQPLTVGSPCDDELGAGHFFAVALSKRSVCGSGQHCSVKDGTKQVCTKD